MAMIPPIISEFQNLPQLYSIYKVGNTTFVKVVEGRTGNLIALYATSVNRTLTPYKNGVKILPHPQEKALNNFYIDIDRLLDNYGSIDAADLINKLAEQDFFKSDSAKGVDAWKAKTYLDTPTLVESAGNIYKLIAAVPYVSANLATELAAGDWQYVTKYADTVLNNTHRAGDGTDHAQVSTNKTNADASKVKTDFISVTQPVDLDALENDVTSLAGSTGLTYESTALAMAVLPLPADNTPFTVRNSATENGYYIYLAAEVGGYKKIGNLKDYTTDETLFIDADNIIKANVSLFEERIIWHTGDSKIMTLSFTPTDIINIFINGSKLYTSSQYTISLPNIINILSALVDNDVITIQYEHIIN